jgi:hypothetical protein
LTRKVAVTDATGVQTPEDAGDHAALSLGHLVRQHGHLAASSALKRAGRCTTRRGRRDVGRQRDHEDPDEPPSRPITIHGRRMPQREAVRSLILPKNGFPTIVNRAPVPATSDKTVRRSLRAHERVHLEGQGDEQRCQEQQARTEKANV